MPELPEVETVRRGLVPLMTGRTIKSLELRRANLRRPLPRDLPVLAQGATILALRRRAKYLLIDLSNAQTMIVHLGMTGGFFVRPLDETLRKHDHIILHLDNQTRLAFHDPRRFGHLGLCATGRVAHDPLLKSLGPEPLADTFSSDQLYGALHARKTSIKAALLDQSVVAGLGNIYVCEALFAAGVHPEREAGSLTKTEVKKLHAAIQTVLTQAIAAGGSTLKDYRHPDGELGFFQDNFAVYGRAGEKCPGCACKKSIQRLVQNGRSTFYCSTRQR